jgi:hypothetical protein
MNMNLLCRWLTFFSESVATSVQRPIVLVMDGYSSHYSLEAVESADRLGIKMVCMPADSTHLFQPLDVAVFGSFKGRLRRPIHEFQGDTGAFNIDKANALRLVM